VTRTALLWHCDIPPQAGLGSPHYDWLLERERGGKLISFRLWERPDSVTCTGFEAERLADHRPEYLDYQGPVSGGRGRVERLAQGVCTGIAESPGSLEAVCVFDATPDLDHHFYGHPAGSGRWLFVCRVGPRGELH
jgi:hypothetical protein